MLSEEGNGSTFGVVVRLHKTPTKAMPLLHTSLGKDIDMGPDLAGLRIILAEDNDFNAEVMQGMLEAAGATENNLSRAMTGAEAVALFTQASAAGEAAHLVIMDLNMGYDGDGLEVTQPSLTRT